MSGTWFPLLRNIAVTFAFLMLAKYYIYLLVAPFHSVKEARREWRLLLKRKRGKKYHYHPLVSVVIPAWNEEVGLLKTVRSVIQNGYPETEIIVVNDGSTDRSHKLMQQFVNQKGWQKRHKAVSLRYFYKENGGKGHALNFGILRARGEIIVTIDADSILEKSALYNLTRYFEDPGIDAGVGNVKVANKTRNLLAIMQRLEYLFGFYYKRAHSVMGAEYIFGGACAAFRRSATFDKHGLFDTTNKTEDIEMSVRLRYLGHRSVYMENVVCYTEGAASLTGLVNQRLRWKKGRFDTFIKYRRLFFSVEPQHNRLLAWFVLPMALLAEFQLLFEPIGFGLLAAYSVMSGDYLSVALGMLFIAVIYLVNAIFDAREFQLSLVLWFPLTWPLFYLLVWVEYIVLWKSLVMLLRGDDIVWQSWQRQGVGAKS